MSDQKDLWQQATSFEGLHSAWAKVDANAGSAGGDAVTRKEFRDDMFARLNQLRADILSGRYRSRPFRKVSIPKKKPGYRILTIPSIRDRVLHTAIAMTLEPYFEQEFEDSSFAYRKGKGVQKAVARIEHWRDRGYDIVIEADIVGYFDNIRHDLLTEKIEDAVGQVSGYQPMIGLINRLLLDQAKALGTPGVGLVQGSPLSPLLANLYLDALDEEIDRQGVKIVRFADDFVILCKSSRKASRVLDHVVKVLDTHGLRLHDDGTRIVNFDQGFDFVGYLFVRSLSLQEKSARRGPSPRQTVKSEVTDDGVIQLENEGSKFDQGGRVLYVLDEDHRLDIRNRSFSVKRSDDVELIAIPHRRVGRIEVGTGVEAARTALDLAADTGTDLAFVDGFGQTKTTLFGRQSRHGGLHLRQAEAVLSPKTRLLLARKFVAARLANQREQIMRLNRRQKSDVVDFKIKQLKHYRRTIAQATTVQALMGYEGAATKLYWSAIGELLEAGRSKPFQRSRPATDAANATINYLTAILERDVRAAAQTAGLHLGFAVLHGTRDKHDGLVFDLMEPFRAPLTAGLAVFLFRARRLKADMFQTATGKEVHISKAGRQAIVAGYETAISKKVGRPDGQGSLGWRAMMVHQSRDFAVSLKTGAYNSFKPFLLNPATRS